jgi:hypothetical protein
MKFRRPSLGFAVVILTYVSTTAFLAWGFTTPPLDRISVLDHQLKIGEVWELPEEDVELLQGALLQYKGLATALLSDAEVGVVSAQREGWIETPEVTIIRTNKSEEFKFIELDVQTPEKYLPIKVNARGASWKDKLHIDREGVYTLALPPTAQPELISLKLKGKDLRADPSVLGIRVSFRKEAPASKESPP